MPIKLPRRAIVRGSIIYYKMEFHPDGKRILSVFQVDGKEIGLGWFNIETGEATKLVTPPRWSRFALSQTGDRVAYTVTHDKDGEQGGNNGPFVTLVSQPSDGSPATELGDFPARIHDLCWQDDDRALIVATDLGGAFYDLWHVPIKDGRIDMATARQLTFGQADEHRPSISANGRSLLFTENAAGSTTLRLRDLIDGGDSTVRATKFDFNVPTGMLKLATQNSTSTESLPNNRSLRSCESRP